MSLKLNVDENKFLEGAIKEFWGLQATLFLDIELRKSMTKSILPTGSPRLARPPRPGPCLEFVFQYTLIRNNRPKNLGVEY